MNIGVFIKQVPDTDSVQWTADNNIDRAKTDSVLNPDDIDALAASIELKKRFGARVSAVSMGPEKAFNILKQAIAAGADDAFLLCDSKFIGSDTCATSKVLAAAAKKLMPEADLILAGQSASDGETAQTGPETAVRLNMPFLNHVTEIIDIKDGYAYVQTETETEKTQYKVKLPAVLCIKNYKHKLEPVKIEGWIKAHDYDLKKYGMYELGLKEGETGVKGSPTYVSKVYRAEEGRNCAMLDKKSLLKLLKEGA